MWPASGKMNYTNSYGYPAVPSVTRHQSLRGVSPINGTMNEREKCSTERHHDELKYEAPLQNF